MATTADVLAAIDANDRVLAESLFAEVCAKGISGHVEQDLSRLIGRLPAPAAEPEAPKPTKKKR